jgi:rubrerythrin
MRSKEATVGETVPIGLRHDDGHWQCRRCGYEWVQRDPDRNPKKCPFCFMWLDKPWNGRKQ